MVWYLESLVFAEIVDAVAMFEALAVACVGAVNSPKVHKNAAIIEILPRTGTPMTSESDFLPIIYGVIEGEFLLNKR